MRVEEVDVIVLCGGRGSRLGTLTARMPKPLLPIAGRPFLLGLLSRLQGEGFRRFILAAHYLAGRFAEFIAEHQKAFPEMQLVVEPEPLGTGGALRHAVQGVGSATFLALNGDTWLHQEMKPVLEDHQRQGSVFTALGVQAGNVDGGSAQKGVWQMDASRRITAFVPRETSSAGWINAGVYVIEREFALAWPAGSYSLEERFPVLLKGKRATLFPSDGRLLDIGTPTDYRRAEALLGAGDRAA